jgi:hypothetical protein
MLPDLLVIFRESGEENGVTQGQIVVKESETHSKKWGKCSKILCHPVVFKFSVVGTAF